MTDLQHAPGGGASGFLFDVLAQQGDPLPKTLYVELADYCNLNCMFCRRGAVLAGTDQLEGKQLLGKGGFIEVDKLKKLETPLRAAEILGLSGRIGEPLLHPELEAILRWVYGINPRIRLRITTNGTALSRKMAALLSGHLDFVAISLNASNAEAYFREMRPVGGQNGVANPRAWWRNLTQRIGEFIAALPIADRDLVRMIMPVQTENIDDVFDFVRLVSKLGGSHAIFTPMLVHDDSKLDMSVYWIKDHYNDVMDEAAALGARLGVRVEAGQFYTNPKPENLEALCREPVELAYVNMENVGGAAPCCNWIEDLIPTDVYSDGDAFERFWNHDILRRLRVKRDFKSCQACRLGRAFDEVEFHFTSRLKKNLIAARRCNEVAAESGYPDSELVRVCRSLSLDLRSLRRTVLELGMTTGHLDSIRREGLGALPKIDLACWEAFLTTDAPANCVDLALGGCFPGIGWSEPDNDPVTRVSARWMGGLRAASVFVHVVPECAYKLRVTAHRLRLPEMVEALEVSACDWPLEIQRDTSDNGAVTLTAVVSNEITKMYGGRLRLALAYKEPPHGDQGWVSFSRLELTKALWEGKS